MELINPRNEHVNDIQLIVKCTAISNDWTHELGFQFNPYFKSKEQNKVEFIRKCELLYTALERGLSQARKGDL